MLNFRTRIERVRRARACATDTYTAHLLWICFADDQRITRHACHEQRLHVAAGFAHQCEALACIRLSSAQGWSSAGA